MTDGVSSTTPTGPAADLDSEARRARFGPREAPTTALLTDQYELTMLQASLHSGAAHRRSVFEAFARRLPAGRRYGVVAGTGRLLEELASFRFDDAQLAFLGDHRIVDDTTLAWLAADRRPAGARELADGIAGELAYTRDVLIGLGLEPARRVEVGS